MHSDVWFDLDAVFADTRRMTPSIYWLADALRTHAPTAVCGPLRGGAFLAHAIASRLRVRFLFTERIEAAEGEGLFTARYRVPPAFRASLEGQRIAVVDDMISAGSSVRATIETLTEAKAEVVAVATMYLPGSVAAAHFAGTGLPLIAMERFEFHLWTPQECPLCAQGGHAVAPD